MSLITLPVKFVPRSCALRLSVNQLAHAAPYGGSEQVIDLLNDRWMLSCELSENIRADAGWREGFVGALRGKVNTVALYHFTRPLPLGTLRGSLTLSASAVQGAASVVLTGGSPATGTLLAGDLIGVSGLLLQVASDCTAAAGVITVPLVNRLRKALASGAAVTWDRPTAAFRMMSNSGVGTLPDMTGALSFDFAEAIA